MPETDNPSKILDIRLTQLASKAGLAMTELEKWPSIIDRLDDSTKEEADKVIRQASEYGTIYTDIAWVHGLLDAGINHATILQVWNLKDETMRGMKEDSQQSSPES